MDIKVSKTECLLPKEGSFLPNQMETSAKGGCVEGEKLHFTSEIFEGF